MKKIVCFLLAICFAFPAVACGRPAGQEPDDGMNQSQQQGQTDDGGTEQGGSGEEPSPAEETLKLSARMFDNARVNLNGADSIGLIAEEEEDPVFEGETINRTYLVSFREDGTFEKITFVFTSTDAYSDGSYEVTQEQIEPYPVNLFVTEEFIFVAYSNFEADAGLFENPEHSRNFDRSDENFAIDRSTGKLYSLNDLDSFYVCGDQVVSTDGVGLGTDSYYCLSAENGALTVTDLMPNKNIYVYGTSADAFGNIFVCNDSVARKEGNIVYVTERVGIGDDGYAYVLRNDNYYGGLDASYTIKRYGADGVLQESWDFTDTVIRFAGEYSSEEDGYVVLLRDEMYVLRVNGSDSWYATWAGGAAHTYDPVAEIFMTREIPVSANVLVSEEFGGIWYYDLTSEKRIDGYDPYVESFGNQGLVMQGDSLYSENGGVFVRVEDARGTLIYKLEETTDGNGLPSVQAVLYREIEYDANVLTIQPLN